MNHYIVILRCLRLDNMLIDRAAVLYISLVIHLRPGVLHDGCISSTYERKPGLALYGLPDIVG